MSRLARKLKSRLKKVPGVLVENKRYTLAIHYRSVHAKHLPVVHDTVFDLMPPHQKECRITEGKRVIEVRPRVPWSKGTAVQRVLRILKRERQSCVIYIGDDTTDEDAFEVLKRRGITIVVGKKQLSHAAYWVRNPGEVRDFLALLALLITERAA
jgi:trehalose-phosphatase